MIKIPLKDGSDYPLPWKFRVELNELYFDVEQELEDMRIWCLANPTRLKTKSGMPRFIVSWLKRSGKRRPKTAPLSITRALAPISQEERERNKKHRAKINGEVRTALVAVGLHEDDATQVVTAIAKGLIPHVTIAY